jgi:hypothetical protein
MPPAEKLSSFRHFDADQRRRPVAKTTSVELWVDLSRLIFVALNLRLSLWGRMRLGPKGCCNGKRLGPWFCHQARSSARRRSSR